MLNVLSARLLRSGFFCALSALAVMPAGAASLLVSAGGDLQGALNQAQGGDTIILAAGAAFVGNFTLPANNTHRWITIQSSAMSSLPAAGKRVSSTQALSMPRIVTPNAGAVLTIPGGANYYRIEGIEFTVASGVYVNDLIDAGTSTESSVSQLPHHLVFDRDYVHGDPVSGGKRGLALNSATTTVENSYFADFTSDWQDTQAICGWNGSGPFTITNNHLEAGTEIVAFGGAVPSISGLIPSNIVVENNEFYKPMSWWWGSANYIGRHIRAKNHLELKNAQNVTIQNNTFSGNFVGADQLGFMLVFGVRDESGQVPWATVANVIVKNNLFQHTAAGVLFMGHDGDGGGTAGECSLSNNTWLDMGGYGGDGRMYQIMNDVRGITIDHETAFPAGWLMVFAEGASSSVKVTNSIFTSGWGIAGDGGLTGESAMSQYNSDGFFANNAVISGWTSGFTGAHFATNVFPGSVWEAGFVNFTGNNVRLTANSPLIGQANDGLNLGLLEVNTVSGLEVENSAPAPNGWVNIVSESSGNCLDVPGSSTAPGTALIHYPCTGNANQQFAFAPVWNGYKITARHSGQQFDMAGGPSATSPGALLLQYPYWGGANEVFEISKSVGGYVTLHPAHSQLCLGAATAWTNNGLAIVQEPCSGADNQKWKFVPVQ